MRLLISIVVVFVALQTAHAGHIEFYSKKSLGGERVGTLRDDWNSDFVVGKRWKGHDNKITSIKLKWVTPGTRIQLFADPKGSKKFDWLEIEVKRWVDDIPGGPRRYLDWKSGLDKNYYKLTFHSSNKNDPPSNIGMPGGESKGKGLNGKVSRIKVFSAIPHNPPLEGRLNLCLQKITKFEWRKKNGAAEEIRDQGSKYRIWYPTVNVRADNSIKVHFKLDHIRGGQKDDHAQVRMTFDNELLLTGSDSEISLADDKTFRTTSDEIWKNIPDATKANPYAVVGRVATVTASELYALGGSLFEKGGRKNFPDVVSNMISDIGDAVAGCDADKFWNPPPDFPPVQ